MKIRAVLCLWLCRAHPQGSKNYCLHYGILAQSHFNNSSQKAVVWNYFRTVFVPCHLYQSLNLTKLFKNMFFYVNVLVLGQFALSEKTISNAAYSKFNIIISYSEFVVTDSYIEILGSDSNLLILNFIPNQDRGCLIFQTYYFVHMKYVHINITGQIRQVANW